jgi:P27 family predicted phage terminase small subunit
LGQQHFFWRIDMNEPHKHPSYRLSEIPEPPGTMSEGARQEWNSLAKTLYELRTARPADLRLLELLCEILADISVLEKTIRTDGYTVEAGSGGRKGHPALASLEKARRQAQNLLGRFGLVPGTCTVKAPKFHAYNHKTNYGPEE